MGKVKISIDDVLKRMRAKNIIVAEPEPSINVINVKVFDDKDAFLENNALYVLHNWTGLSTNINEAYSRAIDVFIDICENCSESRARDAYEFMLTEVNKVRDAEHLQNSNTYKLTHLKSKISTKIDNKIEDVTDKIEKALQALQGKQPSLPTTASSKSESCVNEYLRGILNRIGEINECDRIINNYNRMCRRFNMERISEEFKTSRDLYCSIYEACSLLDTYDGPFINKYNTMIETMRYMISKSYIPYPSEKIIEAVTDYFVYNYKLQEAELSAIIDISKLSTLFEESDFSNIEYLFNRSVEEAARELTASDIIAEYCTQYDVVTEADVRSAISTYIKGNPDEHKDDEIKQLINDFRKQASEVDLDKKSPMLLTHFKSLVTKIYTKNPEQIVDEVPKLLGIIRMTFVLGATAMNPIVGLVSLITDYIIKMTLERKQCEKIINAYTKEIEAVASKIETAKDAEKKEKLSKYQDKLKSDLEKIKDYEKNIYSDDENAERDAEEYDFDDDFDFDDEDWEFDESAICCGTILMISNLIEGIHESLGEEDVDGIVYGNLYKFSNDEIDALADFSITVPMILEKKALKSALESYRDEIKSSSSIMSCDYVRLECVNSNIYKLESATDVYNTSSTVKDSICVLNAIDEISKVNSIGYVTEMNLTNTLKLAMNRLKNSAIKLSDKEKKLSNDIDASVNNVSKGVERAMMNDSREAVIKGSILPSASKTIKLALISGAAWAVNPAIAVIGVLGTFACHKKLEAKQRQLVLDDIEIELKMCERYLRQAEDKNDMKAVREIEKIQRNLLRQQQRIKYKMKVVYNQDVPSVASND